MFKLLDDGTVTQQVSAPNFAEGETQSFEGESLDIQTILAKVQPSVVTIDTGQETLQGQFLGTGTGVVISEDAMILTNAHVISGADDIKVVFWDGTETTATLIGSFPDDDIAVIQADNIEGATPATLGSSEDMRVGDQVIAIGNALDLGATPSVTLGIISAKGRTISDGLTELTDLIQTDAAINQGNSGGPLVNSRGDVIGINTAILADAQSVGFAISIDVVRPLIEQLVNGGGTITPDTPFLGVTSQTLTDVSPEKIDQLGPNTEEGAYVVEIVPGSAADDAGLLADDIVIAIDGETVDSSEDVGRIVRANQPGDVLSIEVERNGENQTFEAELGTRGN